MPFRTVLCLLASAGLIAAEGQSSSAPGSSSQQPPAVTNKKDFVNPNLGGLIRPPDARSQSANKPFTIVEPKSLTPDQPAKLLEGTKECSIPLKWAKIQKSAPDPRGEKWIGPHPERVDPIYGPTPAPVCMDAENKLSAKPDKPSK